MFQRCELKFDGDIVVEDEVAAEENWLTKAEKRATRFFKSVGHLVRHDNKKTEVN